MIDDSFVFSKNFEGEFHTAWQAPSNIALVKYWGKNGQQLPKNPSISFTLSQCVTKTEVRFRPRKANDTAFDFLFDRQEKADFHPKIMQFLDRIYPYLPSLENHHLSIATENSFPHSSGIASSASAMAALALCVVAFEKKHHPQWSTADSLKKASFLSRLGSGSAARSIAGPLMVWGESTAYSNSSDLYAIAPQTALHSVFNDYQDSILIVDKGQKKVSSTLGHGLMEGHPFASQRFEQAHQNLNHIKTALATGDLDLFIDTTEAEALSLHAMMMTSNPRFVLMQPQTLAIIHKTVAFRKETHLPICFTLDAGANVHLLYPKAQQQPITDFIQSELVAHCQDGQYISDQLGTGAQKL